jgi:hypothetical protein
MAGIQFTSGQHRFHLADKVREYLIQLPASVSLNLPVMLARSAR